MSMLMIFPLGLTQVPFNNFSIFFVTSIFVMLLGFRGVGLGVFVASVKSKLPIISFKTFTIFILSVL